jgi:hypothetical protein
MKALARWVELRGLEPLTPHCQGGWLGAANVRRCLFPQVKEACRRQRTAADNLERRRLATTVAPSRAA